MKCIYNFNLKKCREVNWDTSALSGEIMFQIYLKGIGCEEEAWIHIAQDGVHCRSLVNTEMSLCFI
jgi:hypothetical protein